MNADPLPSIELILSLLGLVFLLICSAFISGSEVALFGLTSTELNQLKEEPTKKGLKTLALLSAPKNYWQPYLLRTML
jgi:putative hemolysin